MSTSGGATRVVIMVQENHTTDHYFRSMRAFGANVATDGPISPNPPTDNPPHDRHAYYRWLTAHQSGAPTRAPHDQFDTIVVLPFYAYLAATGAFLENHCSGFGTNSTPNHLLIVGGQSPTLRNPPRSPQPLWDMPSLPGHAAEHGVTWKAYTGASGYPVEFYTQLHGSPNIVRSNEFVADAAAGTLPTLSMMWHDSPADEHPPADVSIGHDTIWRAVTAVVDAGLWDTTVFLLTWDDWGGFDDHVVTPNLEHTPDGVQLAYGPRVPLLMFGGHVPRGTPRAGSPSRQRPRPRRPHRPHPPHAGTGAFRHDHHPTRPTHADPGAQTTATPRRSERPSRARPAARRHHFATTQ